MSWWRYNISFYSWTAESAKGAVVEAFGDTFGENEEHPFENLSMTSIFFAEGREERNEKMRKSSRGTSVLVAR